MPTEYPGGAIGRNGAPRASFAILLVDDDAAAADGLGVGASHAVIGAHLIVVDNSARTVQDLDPELRLAPIRREGSGQRMAPPDATPTGDEARDGRERAYLLADVR